MSEFDNAATVAELRAKADALESASASDSLPDGWVTVNATDTDAAKRGVKITTARKYFGAPWNEYKENTATSSDQLTAQILYTEQQFAKVHRDADFVASQAAAELRAQADAAEAATAKEKSDAEVRAQNALADPPDTRIPS